MKWQNIINIKKVKYEDGKTGDFYKWKSAPLSEPMGAKKLGFHVEILDPGMFSCPYHFHHSEEELFLVIEGKAMLRQAGVFREISEGDLVHFSNNADGAHQFYNHSDQPFRFLALSTKDELEVCEYPDSGKIMVGKLRKVFQTEKAVDYFTGEEDPRRFWPKEYLK